MSQRMKHHWNLIIDAGEADRLLLETILNAVLIRHPALQGKEIEIVFCETFDVDKEESETKGKNILT